MEKVTLGSVLWYVFEGVRDKDMWDTKVLVGPCMVTHITCMLHVQKYRLKGVPFTITVERCNRW